MTRTRSLQGQCHPLQRKRTVSAFRVSALQPTSAAAILTTAFDAKQSATTAVEEAHSCFWLWTRQPMIRGAFTKGGVALRV